MTKNEIGGRRHRTGERRRTLGPVRAFNGRKNGVLTMHCLLTKALWPREGTSRQKKIKRIESKLENKSDGKNKSEKLTKIRVRDYLAKQYPLFNYLDLKEKN